MGVLERFRYCILYRVECSHVSAEAVNIASENSDQLLLLST